MAALNDTASMALFCDFENIALGVRDAQYEKFDIRPVLERLLAKGSIVVKKAYCDWERYKGFKAAMHEANFELIEIPHVRQSGKNSADIRMVVDALDLCYTKAHVDTFVIISGDSDFSPLVSKLRENAKKVIGVGVKQSCSDLLVTNCDEFIYYDDLVREREGQRTGQRREREKRSPEEEQKRREKTEERKTRAVELASATLADMLADRGDSERVWASVLKEVIKRRNPGFNENYFGFRSFGNLLDEAASRGLLAVGRDEKSGTYVMRAQGRPVESIESPLAEIEAASEVPMLSGDELVPASAASLEAAPLPTEAEEKPAGRRRGRGRKAARESAAPEGMDAARSSNAAEGAVPVAAAESQKVENDAADKAAVPVTVVVEAAVDAGPAELAAQAGEVAAAPAKPRRGGRRPRKSEEITTPAEAKAVTPAAQEAVEASAEPEKAKPARAKRPTRSRKPKAEAAEN